MKIASILPYKENYTLKGAGAVALWISDFVRDSKYKKNTYIIGSTKNKNYLTKNYINIDNINSKLNSTTKEYSNKIINRIKNSNFDILELHNRPIMVREFFGKLFEWKKLDELIPNNFKSGSKYKKTGKAGIFAGSLELVKEGNLSIKQDKLFDEIYIKEIND